MNTAYSIRCNISGCAGCQLSFECSADTMCFAKNQAIEAGWRLWYVDYLVCPACYREKTSKPPRHIIKCENSGCKIIYSSSEDDYNEAQKAAILAIFKRWKDGRLVCPDCYTKLEAETKKQRFICNSNACRKVLDCKDLNEAYLAGWGWYYGSFCCRNCLESFDKKDQIKAKGPVTIEKFAANLSAGIREAVKNDIYHWPALYTIADVIDKAIKG